jgi:hypothetical protein
MPVYPGARRITGYPEVTPEIGFWPNSLSGSRSSVENSFQNFFEAQLTCPRKSPPPENHGKLETLNFKAA